MAVVTLEELVAHVHLSVHDLDTRCEDGDLRELSLLIPSQIKQLALFLMLTDSEIEDIDSEKCKSRVKVLNILKIWKRKHAFRATYKALVEVLLKLGDADTAEKICKWLKEHKVPSQRGESTSARSQHIPEAPSTIRGHALRSRCTLPCKSPGSCKSPEMGESSEKEIGMEKGVVSDAEPESDDSSDISSRTAEAGIKKRRRSREFSMSEEEEGEESQSTDEGGGEKGNGRQRMSNSNEVARIPSVVPPDWIRQTKLHLSPYFPQEGDAVVYFHQGHRLYVEAVKKKGLCSIDNAEMPCVKYTLHPQEFCRVTNVEFLAGPPTLCSITLCEARRKRTFSFQYHDMDGVPDFLVLESLYRKSIYLQWQESDRFRSIIDNEVRFGTVSKCYPNSCWECYGVLWDDKETELLSPWDMEPIPAPVEGEEVLEDSSRISELLLYQEQVVAKSWGGEGEPARILHGLEMLDDLDEAHMFKHPVDLEKHPDYCTIVAFPTDLSTIIERLRNKMYRRKEALLWDVALIEKNAAAFNKKGSLIVKHARVFVQTLSKFIKTPGIVNPLDCYVVEPEEEMEEASVSSSQEVNLSDLPVATTPINSRQQLTAVADTLSAGGRVLRSGRTLPGENPGSSESPEAGESSEESEMEDSHELSGDSTTSSNVSQDYEDNEQEEDSEDLNNDEGGYDDVDGDDKEDARSSERPRRRSQLVGPPAPRLSKSLMDDEEGEQSQSKDVGGGKKKNGRQRKSSSSSEVARKPSVDWIRQTKLHLSPYFPQVGDVVVYLHQGHRLYVEAVKKDELYPVHEAKMPWVKYTLQPQEFCQVTNVEYLVGPSTLCSITLALVSTLPAGGGSISSSRIGNKERVTFSFKYHDMDSIVDFLVLESLYRKSVYHQWQKGERFQSLINGEVWFGTVREKKAFKKSYPNSYWQCYSVLWDDEETDLLSPWDMEPIPAPVEGEGEQDSSRISELLLYQEHTVVESWGGEGEPARILLGLEMVCTKLDEALMFKNPVDLEKYPSYCTIVAFPTDLSTIMKRLRNKLYRRKGALVWEVVQIERNAVAFNEEDSEIVKNSRVLVQTLLKFIETPGTVDPLDCYVSEPEGEVGVSSSQEVEFLDTSDLPAVVAVTPEKEQLGLASTSSDYSEESLGRRTSFTSGKSTRSLNQQRDVSEDGMCSEVDGEIASVSSSDESARQTKSRRRTHVLSSSESSCMDEAEADHPMKLRTRVEENQSGRRGDQKKRGYPEMDDSESDSGKENVRECVKIGRGGRGRVKGKGPPKGRQLQKR